MAKRKIIKIDEDKCNGCGLCIPNCPEGALKVIDGKVRLISDLFCDGLGACIGHCPQGAITIEEREAEPYNERKVMANVVKQGMNVVREHLEHLKSHGETGYLKEAMAYLKEHKIEIPVAVTAGAGHGHGHGGCPGSRMIDMRREKKGGNKGEDGRKKGTGISQLRQWPIQIHLVPPHAPYLAGADILIAADCVPFAYADFHEGLLKDKILLVGCPKLDDVEFYKEKISAIVKDNDIHSITYAHMEVPCCFGLLPVIRSAIDESGKEIPFKDITITIQGERR